MKVLVKYSAGHSITEPWEKTEYFCPNCGQKNVWACQDGGDYYQGEKYLCLACKFGWNWPGEPDLQDSTEDQQRFEQLPKL